MIEHYPDHMSPEDYRERAATRARASESGIGAAVERDLSDEAGSGKRWSVVVSDGSEHHYIDALAEVEPRASIPPSTVETAIERVAARWPEDSRLRELQTLATIHLTADDLRD